jgi:hypothetical protein
MSFILVFSLIELQRCDRSSSSFVISCEPVLSTISTGPLERLQTVLSFSSRVMLLSRKQLIVTMMRGENVSMFVLY